MIDLVDISGRKAEILFEGSVVDDLLNFSQQSSPSLAPKGYLLVVTAKMSGREMKK